MAKLLARSIIIKLLSQKPQTLSTDLSPVGRDPLLYAANLHIGLAFCYSTFPYMEGRKAR
jgi:hypothetical protein